MRSESGSQGTIFAGRFLCLIVLCSPTFASDSDRKGDYPSPILGVKAGYQAVTYQDRDLTRSGGGVVGAYTGLQLSPRWRWELGYQLHNRIDVDGGSAEVRALLYEASVRYDWYFQRDMSVYGRLGLTAWDVDLSGSALSEGSNEGLSPLGEAGFQYRVNRSAGFHLGYQYIDAIGRGGAARYDSFALTAGLVFHLGSVEQGSLKAGNDLQHKEYSPFQLAPVNDWVSTPTPCTAEGVGDFQNGQTLYSVYFKLDERRTTFSDTSEIVAIVNMLDRYPSVDIELVGYTDSSGDASYNQHLSQRRAEFVSEILLSLGGEPARINTRGAGIVDKAGTDNKTRAKQRRVDINVIAPRC